MHSRVKKTIQDIQNLKIQGARNVAKAAILALRWQIQHSRARSLNALYNELLDAGTALAGARPTEPMLRNIIEDATRYAFLVLKKQARNIRDARRLMLQKEDELLQQMDRDVGQLAKHGAALIPDDSLVLTHCHSSSVTAILRKARAQGKTFEVAVCETRPLYQGRITARELAQHKIKVTLVVDGAMNLMMKKADIVLVGADSVTSRGDLINKVGTSTLAHIARLHDVSFYSAAELYKYSPLTFFGQRERIEERDPKEIWDRPPRGVKIHNPAFDVTAARYINGYITEEGIVPPQSLFAVASQKLKIKI